MENCYEKLLESKWLEKNPSSRHTYGQWKTARRRDWTELLKKSRPLLTIRISADVQFYDTLASMDVFTRRNIEAFKVGFLLALFCLCIGENSKEKCNFIFALILCLVLC